MNKALFSLKAIVSVAILLTLQFFFLNCGQQMAPSQSTGEVVQAPSSACNDSELIEKETRMRAALQSVVTDHSFYFELRRPSLDGRTFVFTRKIEGAAEGVIDENSTLQSASTAKMISASVILDVVSNPQLYPGGGLVNGRQLGLDSLAGDFLPDGAGGTFWRTNTGAIPATSRLKSVTLRHLLSFTSGLELEKSGTGTNCLVQPETTFTHGNCVRNLVTVNLARNTNALDPRTFFYNGAHLSVAALMAVKAAGVANWAELFKKYKELHGVFQGAVSPAAPAATFGLGAYFPYSDGASSPGPAGAMRYRAGDYATFLVKLYSGNILSNAILSQMLSDQTGLMGAGIEYSPMLNSAPYEDWHYGLGLWNECHSSTWSTSCDKARFSSAGSFGSYPFIDFNFYGSTSYPLIGFLGRGGDDSGTGDRGMAVYRSLLNGGDLGVKDLAQEWAANTCH